MNARVIRFASTDLLPFLQSVAYQGADHHGPGEGSGISTVRVIVLGRVGHSFVNPEA